MSATIEDRRMNGELLLSSARALEQYVKTTGRKLQSVSDLPRLMSGDQPLTDAERQEVWDYVQWGGKEPTNERELNFMFLDDSWDAQIGKRLRAEFPDEPVEDFLVRWDAAVDFEQYRREERERQYDELGKAAELLIWMKANPQPATVRQLRAAMGGVSQPTISRWLTFLQREGRVKTSRPEPVWELVLAPRD